MLSLEFIQVGAMSSLLVVVIIYTGIYLANRSPYIGAWLLGWLLFMIAATALLWMPFALEPSIPLIALHFLLILSALSLLWGTHLFYSLSFSRLWVYTFIPIIIWTLLAIFLGLNGLLSMLPIIAFICIIDIFQGRIWLNHYRKYETGRRITGWAYCLLGIHHLDAPYLYLHSQIVPWGYMVTLALVLIASLGTLKIHQEKQQEELLESEERFRVLAENASDLVYRYRLTPTPGYEYVSPSVIAFNGYSPEDHYKDPDLIYKTVHPEDRYMFRPMGQNLNPVNTIWLRFMHRDGHIIWTEQRYQYIFDAQGSIIAIQGIIRDVTERLKMEKQIEYISMHDALTGLYNRSFFEDKMQTFDNISFIPVGVIVCDLDGLKLVNDSLGHEAGDRLLIAAARLVENHSTTDDIVARIGGDEFAMLLPNSDTGRTQTIVAGIVQSVEEYKQNNPHSLLSLSIGFEIKTDNEMSLNETLKKADHNMYREKLYRSQSVHSTIVTTLTNTLKERDYLTEVHSDRLQNSVALLGRSIGLSESRIADMLLFARFHDIGKVGIPDRILFKPEPLTEEEQLEMQRHCEIGFRLAQSGPELITIADWILKHHEWWDGNGYPLALAGEEIPLECRILAIVDAYDAMVSSRPYRQGISSAEALNELRRCSGTQFDPYLVDQFIDLMEKELRLVSKPAPA